VERKRCIIFGKFCEDVDEEGATKLNNSVLESMGSPPCISGFLDS